LIRYLVVFGGAAIGGLARYLLGGTVMARYGGRFPMGTLVVNVTGCFFIGLVMALLTERIQINPLWRLFLVTGILGGYTTFSSFEWETFQLIRDGTGLAAVLNVAGSVALGYLAVWLGYLVAVRA
jgi:fluoride exporter